VLLHVKKISQSDCGSGRGTTQQHKLKIIK